MNILNRLESKEVGLFELISMGFDIYFQNFKSIFTFFCISLFPFQILFYFMLERLEKKTIIGNFSINDCIAFVITCLLLFIVSDVFFIWIAVATENIIYRRNKDAIQVISSRFLPLTGLSIRFSISFFLRYLLLLIPGLIYIVNNQFFGCALILKDQKGKNSFIYSQSIVKGHWWKVLFFGIITTLITFLLSYIFSRTLNPISFISYPEIKSIISLSFVSIISVGFGIANILFFFNLSFHKKL